MKKRYNSGFFFVATLENQQHFVVKGPHWADRMIVMKTIIAKCRLAAVFAAGAGMCFGSALAPAAAQSLREIRAQEAEERSLDREVAYTESICGISLTAVIDWRSAADWPSSVSLTNSCDGALGALEAICRDDEGKSRAQRINRFVCAGDGDGASLRGGALRYGATPGGNGYAETKALLDGAL